MKKTIFTIIYLAGLIYLQAQPNLSIQGAIAIGEDHTPLMGLDIYQDSGLPGLIISNKNGGNASYILMSTDRPTPTNIFNGGTQGSGNKGWTMYAVHENQGSPTLAGTFGINYWNDETGVTPLFFNRSGLTNITAGARFTGNVEVLQGKLTIQGADYAERFYINKVANQNPQSGMLVSIDDQHAGQLKVTDTKYDTQVAGVISGAGGVKTAMVLGQENTLADGDTPVAIAGRVYVYADATKHSIKTGDLLTSSNLAGHVMKVTKKKKAIGAIIGKALEPLVEGTGLILVLVSGQ